MLIKKPRDIKSSEITPKELYLNRRQFIASASAVALTTGAALAGIDLSAPRDSFAGEKLKNLKRARRRSIPPRSPTRSRTLLRTTIFTSLASKKAIRPRTPST